MCCNLSFYIYTILLYDKFFIIFNFKYQVEKNKQLNKYNIFEYLYLTSSIPFNQRNLELI